MARVTVFGAGAMGTAMAMHAARLGLETSLWATPFDDAALSAIRNERKHPALPEHVPSELAIFETDRLSDAAAGCEFAIMGANSGGARSLARMAKQQLAGTRFVVSVSKGLESESGLRVSQVYEEELPGATVIAIGGPCLAAELAEGLPTAAVWASGNLEHARAAGAPFEDRHYQIVYTEDLAGLEYCSLAKNVTAIGMGLLDGLGLTLSEDFKNAKAALYTKGVAEVAEFIQALGGRWETAAGLGGLGDVLVTGLGGRNRLYGELVGAGGDPQKTLQDMQSRGMTVEGVDSAHDVHLLAERLGLDLPYHSSVYRVLLEGGNPASLLEVLC